MFKLISSIIVTALLTTFSNIVLAEVWDSGVYAGIGLAHAAATAKDNTVTSSQYSTVSSTSVDLRLLGGYSFNQHFAIEGELVGLGNYDINNNAPPYQTMGTLKITGASIAAVGRFPITHGFSLFGKLGIANTVEKITPNQGYFYSGANNQSNAGVSVGFGGQYDFNSWLGVRIALDGYSFGNTSGYSGTVSTFGATALFKFF